MTIVNPPTDDNGVLRWANQLTAWLAREFSARPPLTKPTDGVLLLSPSGKVFRVKVDDLGVVTTEEVTT